MNLENIIIGLTGAFLILLAVWATNPKRVLPKTNGLSDAKDSDWANSEL